MKIEVSNGEIIDKLTIIQIKLERIKDKAKLVNLQKEYDELIKDSSSVISINDPLFKDHCTRLTVNFGILKTISATLREIKILVQISLQQPVQCTIKNDRRSELKRDINIKTSSGLIEEKSYEKY